MDIQPYVFFNGRCEEALKFYGEAIGAEVIFQMRYKDAPPDAQSQMRPGTEDKIMHASIKSGSTIWMASDGHCDPQATFSGFSLSLTADDAASAEKYFNALAEGGSVTMPWQATFWSKGFGMVVDRFGLGWMVTVPEG
ncbi:PhnB protein [Burkholderia sp. GAS332]|jgi:PhnB protein|uniref:VOC family protein n=1 Tax=Paraburkholderia TaxID=1822464 RepID=UPI000926C347|nr:VOC family protein [Rudaea sp.]SIO58040.1 PhnB protein [Burkholderia sp. GAS332]